MTTIATFRDSEQAFHDAASTRVGCGDFGDEAYLEGLRALLGSLDDDARLTPAGRLVMQGQIVDALAGRLHSERGRAEYPECAEARIERPLVIVGLARTGTSALHHLLAQDPALQGLELWLAGTPKPRPPRSAWPDDADYRACDERMSLMYERSPDMKAIHQMAAGQVDECWYLLSQSFAHSSFQANVRVPSYAEWWAGHDMRAAYERHRRNLQLIGHREPDRRWLLKDSTHLFDLGAFLDVYPDAMVVHTHRDPAPVIVSTCSLCWSAYQPLNEDPDPGEFGRNTLALWERAVRSAMEVRRRSDARGEGERFFDLRFRDFQRDPLAAIRAIYAHFGLELSYEAESAMRRHREANPPGKHGEHRYDASSWSLSPGEIRERFADYIGHFDIPTADAAG
jgi:hypothetical protein